MKNNDAVLKKYLNDDEYQALIKHGRDPVLISGEILPFIYAIDRLCSELAAKDEEIENIGIKQNVFYYNTLSVGSFV